MPSTILDSAVFRDIFTTPAMRTVFSDENRVQKYLDFEAALAIAQARLKIIPQEACDEIVKHCKPTRSTWPSSRKPPSASAIRCCRSSSSS